MFCALLGAESYDPAPCAPDSKQLLQPVARSAMHLPLPHASPAIVQRVPGPLPHPSPLHAATPRHRTVRQPPGRVCSYPTCREQPRSCACMTACSPRYRNGAPRTRQCACVCIRRRRTSHYTV
ncbi:hypothetical protein HYPSUDRAFT_85655, partial [Hypholoma sublateritium FD-334 SS-4]